MSTPQSQAISLLNAVNGVMAQLAGLRASVNEFVLQYNDANASAAWAAFPTAAQNTDGSLGTADATPNTAHPIDTRVATMAGVNRSQTQANYLNAVALLQAFQAFLTNGAVTAANRNAVIDLFTGG